MIDLEGLPRLAEVRGMAIRPSTSVEAETESEREANNLLGGGWELLAITPVAHPTDGFYAVASLGSLRGGGGEIAGVRLIIVRVLDRLVINTVQINLNKMLNEEGWIVVRADPMVDQTGPFVLYTIVKPRKPRGKAKANKRK